MVYSSSRTGTRTLIKVAMLCALSLSVIPSVRADGSSSSSAAEVCGISDGDKNAGIRAIDDSSCASGGLGCYNDHCRFCKLIETPQSTAFENCTTFGADFPTMAPLVPSSGACEVSSGDAAAGISAFTDANCLYGGLGCFNDHCRFCKVTTTAQSEAFVDCPNNSTAGSTTDAPVDTTTSASSASASASTSMDTDGCTLVPAAGDVEVGISIGTDTTCSAGGLGCINNVCRFCRIRTTTKSAIYNDCATLGTSAANATTAPTDVPTETPAAITTPSAGGETPAATTAAPNTPAETPSATTAGSTDAPASTTAAPADTTCTITASVGDAAVGISIVTDPTCVSGGIGCMNDVCRFCKVTTSAQSAAFMDCSLFATGASTTNVPVADNSDLSDSGDSSTDDSNSSDASNADTPAVPTDATVPTETPAATTTPVSTTETPSATAETPAATTAAPGATTTTPAQQTCTQTVSAGDAAVGINIVTDSSCSAGGVGCIDSVCRFCKVTETTQSAAFVDCTSIGGAAATSATPAATDAATTEVPTETPTEAPTNAPVDASTDAPTNAPTATDATTDAPTTAPTGATCTQTVSAGDAAVGINIITDASCSAGGVGCIDNICRFCKVTETTQSAAFIDCNSASGATTTTEAPAATDAATEAPTETPTVAPTATPTATDAATDAPTTAPSGATCTQTVSGGDAAVGINIVTDASCSAGGVGCIDNICRFCKVTETTQSAAFVDCSSISGGVNTQALTANDEPLDSNQEKAAKSTADEKVEYLSGEQIGAAVAGCVGAVAAVAVIARAAKKSAGNPNEPADVDDEVDETENGTRVSPGPVPTEEPTTADA